MNNNLKKYYDQVISGDYKNYLDVINKFEKNNNKDSKVVFYRWILENNKKNMSIKEYYNLSIKMINNLDKEKVDNYDKYMLIMDILMITAIVCSDNKCIDFANNLFSMAISFGEENDKYSKQNYYDVLNCAYSWIGTIYFSNKEYEKALIVFNKVIDNYYKVKNEPNYKIKEKESVPISQKYIKEITKLLG